MGTRISMKRIVKTMPLSKFDPTEEATVTVRQATTNDIVYLADLFADQTQIIDTQDGDTIKIQKRWNPEEMKRERAFRTLVGCNLIVEETDEPLFAFRSGPNGAEPGNEKKFSDAWGGLPIELKEEIYKRVIEVNVQWDPNREGE